MTAENASKDEKIQLQRRRLGLTTAAATAVSATIPKLLSLTDTTTSNEEPVSVASVTDTTPSGASETSIICGADRHQSQLIMRTASRIGLHMLREDMTQEVQTTTSHTSPHIQQEHFVINSCKVFMDIELPESLSEGWIFISPVRRQEIINSISTTIPFPDAVHDKAYLDFYDQHGFNDNVKLDAARIVQLIINKKEMGIVASELPFIVGKLNDLSCSLEQHTALLTESQVVLKVGVVAQRYVSIQHIDPWVVKSFRLLRSGKEKLEPFNSANFIETKQQEEDSQRQNLEEDVDTSQNEDNKVEETPLGPSEAVLEPVQETATGRRKRKVLTYPQCSKKSRTIDSLDAK